MFPTDRVRFYRLDDPLAVRSIYLTQRKKNPTQIQQMFAEFMEERRVVPEREE